MRIMFGKYIWSLSLSFNLHDLDSKPFSMFGLAHKVQSPKIRAACVKEYPRILLDVSGIEEDDRGLTSLMCDHLIDVDHLVEPSVLVADQDGFPLLPPTSPIVLGGPSIA
jgi:hypothetical protein